MTTLWNLGSVQNEVAKIIPDIPTRLSGTAMYNILDGAISFLENYTGQTVGSVSINQKFHNALLYKSCITVNTSMTLTGADAEDVKLGEFTIKKGGKTSNVGTATETFTKLLTGELRMLGRNVSYYRTY